MSSNLPTPAGPAPDGVGGVPPPNPRAHIRLEATPADLPSAAPAARLRRLPRAALALLLVGLILGGAGLWHSLRTRREWRQIEDALQRRELEAAAALLERRLERRPADAAAWLLAARTARRLGRYGEAERYLNRCQQVGGVTDATRLEWDLFRVQQGDLADIHTRLRKTVHPDDPDAPLVLEALARGYLACGRLRDVLEACDLWLSLQPDHARPWLWRGGVFEQLENFHQALADYGNALEVAPDDREVRLALAGLLVRARRPGPAVEHYQHVLARWPDDEEALLGLAGCRIEQGRSGDALPHLERVLKADPAPARALVLRGKAALELRDPAQAEGWLTRAVRQAPDDAEALHLLLLSLRGQGKYTEADGLAPRLEALRADIARLSELTRFIAADPDDAHQRHEAGVVALRLGRYDEGVRWLLSALRARGDHRPTHAALAEHFRRQGDPRAEEYRRLAQTP